jgi:hypothetical protein
MSKSRQKREVICPKADVCQQGWLGKCECPHSIRHRKTSKCVDNVPNFWICPSTRAPMCVVG